MTRCASPSSSGTPYTFMTLSELRAVTSITVYLTTDRWHTQYRDRWSHDTVYQSRIDSIPKPYPVEVKVPAELTWWQRLRIDIADIVKVSRLSQR